MEKEREREREGWEGTKGVVEGSSGGVSVHGCGVDRQEKRVPKRVELMSR